MMSESKREQLRLAAKLAAWTELETRPIPHFPYYFATDDGGIWSMMPWKGQTWRQGASLRRMSPHVDRNAGYEKVPLMRDGHRYYELVHRLVCAAFHGDVPTGYYCRHKDNNRRNNLPSNLEWGTPQDNSADKLRHGTQSFGENHPSAKLTQEQAREIRRRYRGRGDLTRLAEEYRVSQWVIASVIKNRTYLERDNHVKSN